MERLFLSYGEIDRLKEKYPGKVPIFVEKAKNSKDVPDLKKHKFLVPSNFTVGQLLYLIRRQINLPPEKALYIFINNTLPTSSTLLAELYNNFKSNDGALRVVYTSESTFG
jgi:GABA(A) receptor-associated protein